MKKAALVCLAIGEPYQTDWQQYCAEGWRQYAARHGMDLIVIRDPLDRSPRAENRSAAWQKCLVWSQPFASEYEQIALLDSDIAINWRMAPNVCEQVAVERVGGVIGGSYIHPDLRMVLLTRLRRRQFVYERNERQQWLDDQNALYAYYDLPPLKAGVINTGVIVASPARHRQLFEQIYRTDYAKESRCYEQVPLSHLLLTSGVFDEIDSRFNCVFYETLVVHYPYLMNRDVPNFEELARLAVQAQYHNNFFLHFAYELSYLKYAPP